jgi:hypothetical protein
MAIQASEVDPKSINRQNAPSPDVPVTEGETRLLTFNRPENDGDNSRARVGKRFQISANPEWRRASSASVAKYLPVLSNLV